MPRVNKIYLLLILPAFCQASPLRELTPAGQAAIDQYISQRARVSARAPAAADPAPAPLVALESRYLPLDALMRRTLTLGSASLSAADRKINELATGSLFLNPYGDQGWGAYLHKGLVKLCCKIKAHPRRAERIRRWVADGADPSRIRANMPVDDQDDDEAAEPAPRVPATRAASSLPIARPPDAQNASEALPPSLPEPTESADAPAPTTPAHGSHGPLKSGSSWGRVKGTSR